jgi:hypothetical protein
MLTFPDRPAGREGVQRYGEYQPESTKLNKLKSHTLNRTGNPNPSKRNRPFGTM